MTSMHNDKEPDQEKIINAFYDVQRIINRANIWSNERQDAYAALNILKDAALKGIDNSGATG